MATTGIDENSFAEGSDHVFRGELEPQHPYSVFLSTESTEPNGQGAHVVIDGTLAQISTISGDRRAITVMSGAGQDAQVLPLVVDPENTVTEIGFELVLYGSAQRLGSGFITSPLA